MVLNFQQKNLHSIILPQPKEKEKEQKSLDMMKVSFYLSVVKYDVSVRCFMAANRLFAADSFSQSSKLTL